VVGESGPPSAGPEGLLGDGVAEKHQPRAHGGSLAGLLRDPRARARAGSGSGGWRVWWVCDLDETESWVRPSRV